MSSNIIYFENGITDRDQYWYSKGKSDGFREGSQTLLDLNCKIKMLSLKTIPIMMTPPVEIISTKKEV